MKISLVAAVSKNNVIGNKGKLPWHLPADMHHFRELTMGKPVIMGRKTFESIGKPLEGRESIVMTSDPNYQAEGRVVVHSIEEALKAAEGNEEVVIIGGGKIYEEFLPQADRIYLTEIHQDFEGDTYFPEFDQNEWQETSRQDFEADEKNQFAYSFLTLERKE